MARESAAFLIYIDDWLSSQQIAMMDAEEERGYLRLLMREWKEADCCLPDDDAQLAITSLLGPQWFKPTKAREKRIGNLTSGQKLRLNFERREGADGRIFNSRLMREREYQQSIHDKRSKSAATAAQSRWSKQKSETPDEVPDSCVTHASRNADAMPTQCVEDANYVWVSSLKFSVEELQSLPPEKVWELYWSAFVASGKPLNHRDEEKALRKFLCFQRDEQIMALSDAQRKLENGTWPSPELTPFPFNHLQSEPWTRIAATRTIPDSPQNGRKKSAFMKALEEA